MEGLLLLGSEGVVVGDVGGEATDRGGGVGLSLSEIEDLGEFKGRWLKIPC